jgi:hypothetical protein
MYLGRGNTCKPLGPLPYDRLGTATKGLPQIGASAHHGPGCRCKLEPDAPSDAGPCGKDNTRGRPNFERLQALQQPPQCGRYFTSTAHRGVTPSSNRDGGGVHSEMQKHGPLFNNMLPPSSPSWGHLVMDAQRGHKLHPNPWCTSEHHLAQAASCCYSIATGTALGGNGALVGAQHMM